MTPITNFKINLFVIVLLALLTAFSSHANPAPHAYSYLSPQAATDEQGRLLWREAYHPYSSRLLFQSPIKTITALASSSAPSRTRCTVFLTSSLPPGSPFPCELESIQDYGTNDRWFTGKPYEEDTGLSYFGARSYDPLLGRFMGVDPQGFDEKNLHSFNRYAYGNNNPYKYVDPDGEAAVLLWAVGGALFLHDVLGPPQPVPGHPGALNSVITIPGPLGILGASAKVGASAAKEALQHGDGVVKVTTRGGETAATKAGRQAHKDYNPGPGYEKEVTLPSGKRADAVNWETRDVRELKPDNSRAIREGQKQVQGYRKELEGVTGEKWTCCVDTYKR